MTMVSLILDLKPDNATINNDMLSAARRLSITDFDTAKFITGVETVIEEQRGTTGQAWKSIIVAVR